MRARGGRRRRRAGLLGLVGIVGLVGAACTPAAPPPATVLIYGDSLTNQSRQYLTDQLADQAPGWRVLIRSFGGTALCDYLDAMQQDGDEGAQLVVVQFSGNAGTSCMGGTPYGSQAWIDKYRADAEAAASLWQGRGVQVLFVGSPRGVCETAPHPLDAGYQSAAAAHGAEFSDSPERALTVTLQPALPEVPDVSIQQAQPPVYAAGEEPEPSVRASSSWPCAPPDVATEVFAFEMACLPGETEAMGCETATAGDGSTASAIPVRDGTAAAPGGHFPCPGYTGTGFEPCTTYSAGIVRFGGAITAEIVQRLS